MVTKKLKELAVVKAKLAILEKDLAVGLNKELAALPSRYGFRDVKSFARAVKGASVRTSNGETAHRPRKRATITDAMRSEVKRLVEEGKTGAAIASLVGISLPSVQNIKKAFGLVRTRT